MLTRAIRQAKKELKSATVRDFSGGWNELDDDLNLNTKYAKKLFNVAVTADEAVTARYGTRLFANLNLFTSTPNAAIVNIVYFSNAIVVVCSNGDLLRVYGDGTVARIWDGDIAAALPGSPTGWGPTSFASFAEFNNELIVCNGTDKPLIVFADHTVDYLQDIATNTNINTPICKYVTACDRYIVMAGDPVNPYRIHISARDTSGTFFGDPDPNDAVQIDVGSMLNGASYIRGISSFRGKLIISFAEGTIVASLGQYIEDEHTPQFEDPIEQYGGVSHRSMISYGDDMLMLDLGGVPSLKRTVFTGTLRPERVSDLIDPDMTARLRNLTFEALEDRTFAIYNQRDGQFLFFIPNGNTLSTTTETKAYSYIYIPTLKVASWARYDGWNFTCGCRTLQGEIVFGDKNGKLWLYGSEADPIAADYFGDPSINSGQGVPITFDWELPWTDINRRTRSKTTKYIAMDTRGTASFSVSMYIDRLRFNELGVDAPELRMDFQAGDTPGFGGGWQPYGGGRNTSYERHWAWTAKFNIMKLRFSGQITGPLKFISISLLYHEGGFFR